MKTRAIPALVAVAGAAAGVSAQNTVTYSFSLNGGGNAITVAPGAAVNVVISATLNPGLGASLGNGTVWGLADSGFNISGVGPAGLGTWSNHTLPDPYNFLYGIACTAGTIAGYNVNGAIFGTGAPWVVPVPPTVPGTPITNPDEVWSGTFTVSANPTLGSVLNLTLTGLEPANVWVGNPPFPSGVFFQGNAGLGGSITIIPAPAGLALLGLGGLIVLRRRR